MMGAPRSRASLATGRQPGRVRECRPGCFPVTEVIADVAAGKMVVVIDDHGLEIQGELMVAAQHASAAVVHFMSRNAGGLICLALTPERCEELQLPPMVAAGPSGDHPAFTVTIDSRRGGTTGMSVHEQAHTMRLAGSAAIGPQDIMMPGHVHPLRARAGGVLERAGYAEAAVDLARFADLAPAGVICEIQNADGSMARGPDLYQYCVKHHLKMITIADLASHRRRHDKVVDRVVAAALPTQFGDFRAFGYRARTDGAEHVAFVTGEVSGPSDALVRVHFECRAGDILHSTLCPCRQRLEESLRRISEARCGVLVYLRPESGLGLCGECHAARISVCDDDRREVTAPDVVRRQRGYRISEQILRDLGVKSLQWLIAHAGEPRGFDHSELAVAAEVWLTAS